MSWFIRNENFKTYIRRYPITSLIITINVLVFLIMTFQGGTTNTETLIRFGAYFKQGVLAGEWYRLFTPIFIHIGLEHLLFNNFSILIFAPGLEIILGKIRYLSLYLLTGVAGFVLTFFFSGPHVLAAGASGAIFGIYGMYAYLCKFRRDIMDRASRQIIMPILLFAIVSTFLVPGISITGHIGGVVGGFLLGFVMKK